MKTCTFNMSGSGRVTRSANALTCVTESPSWKIIEYIQ